MSAVTADGPGRAGGDHSTGTGAVRLRALSARAARAPLPAAKALAGTVTVFLLSSMLTFGLGAMSGADPGAAVLGITATPADIARMNHQFGLDRPLPVQYVSWLGHALRGDLGRSWFTSAARPGSPPRSATAAGSTGWSPPSARCWAHCRPSSPRSR